MTVSHPPTTTFDKLGALFCLGILLLPLGCTKSAPSSEPEVSGQAEPSKSPPPTKTASVADENGEKVLPTPADLTGLVDRATRIEARTTDQAESKWSKDLTADDIANLRASVGNAEISGSVPRCLPKVNVTFFEGSSEIARLGAFCSNVGPIRFDIDGRMGSIVLEHPDRFNAAIRPHASVTE